MDDAAGRLCPLFPEGNPGQDPRETAAPLDTVLPERFARTTPRWMLAGRSGDVLIREVGYGDDVVLAAAAGPLVAGRPWRPELSRDTPYPWENRREAGLWFFSPQRHARLVSQSPRADRIGADAVYAVVDDPDGKRRWLATDDGLAVLDADDRVIAVLDRDDGLLANRLTGGARLDGRLYFSAAWGDRGGGLAVFNPQTSVFTGRFVSDGLASDKLAAIAPAGHRLKLFYGVEQSRYGRGGGQFPPGVFDPRTGAVQPNCPPWLSGDGGLGRADSAPGANQQQPLPYLGGPCLAQQRLGGKTYLCGAQGLVIFSSAPRPAPAPPELAVRLVVDPDAKLLAEARQAQVTIDSPADLQAAMKEANPLLRARALAKVLGMRPQRRRAFVPVLATAVRDPHLRPRATAVALLSMIDDDAAIAALQPATGDRDPYLRAVAGLALLRHGQLPPTEQIKEMLDSQFGNYPFDAESTVGVLVDRGRVQEALAPHADEAIFRLLLEHPPNMASYNRSTFFPQLGESLRRHPAAAVVLLAAYDDEPFGTARRDFARDVFQCAGRQMLPLLYEALQSKDRVVRSNAARACGAIGDAAAIAHLIRALDLESGLSRASIVWAAAR